MELEARSSGDARGEWGLSSTPALPEQPPPPPHLLLSTTLAFPSSVLFLSITTPAFPSDRSPLDLHHHLRRLLFISQSTSLHRTLSSLSLSFLRHRLRHHIHSINIASPHPRTISSAIITSIFAKILITNTSTAHPVLALIATSFISPDTNERLFLRKRRSGDGEVRALFLV